MITRLTNDRLYHLRPGEGVEEILFYLLLLNIQKYGLLLHGFIVMSNHVHIIVSDPNCNLPAFARDFFGESGRALQTALNTDRTIWGNKRYVSTELLDRDAGVRALAYCQTNPTEAGMTLPEDWPGLTSARYRIGDVLTARRPDVHFSENRPESVQVQLSPLPVMKGEPPVEVGEVLAAPPREQETSLASKRGQLLQRDVEEEVQRRVRKILERREKAGQKKLAGAAVVIATSRLTRGSRPFGGITPRFMSLNRDLRETAIARRRQFHAEHEQARQRYTAGEKNVLFPYGTYGYRELLGVRVKSGGEAA